MGESRLKLIGDIIRAGGGGHKTAIYKCVCGTEKRLRMDRVRRCVIVSCGCLRRETTGELRRTHGKTNSTEHRVWAGMRQRCRDVNQASYKNYGGRGIGVCDRWLNSFEAFLEDMGKKPSRNHSLDRINNNKGYHKENCRWATKAEQDGNKRGTVFLEAYGIRLARFEWAKALEISTDRIRYRQKAGWSDHKALFGDEA